LIKAGCCGFGLKGGVKAYYKSFEVVELQSTFYKLPRIETAQKWRRDAPQDFEFVVKAWQAITHPLSSPTWKRGEVIPDEQAGSQYGHLRPTASNLDSWERTLEICEQLDSRVCVVQCPPSFELNRSNVANMRRFFGRIPRDRLDLAWEPRHRSWHNKPKVVRKLCNELRLVHVVDLLKREPQSTGHISYIRLHGLPAELSYRYSYTDRDLKLLLQKVTTLDTNWTYVLFNNVTMANDCIQFKELLASTDQCGG